MVVGSVGTVVGGSVQMAVPAGTVPANGAEPAALAGKSTTKLGSVTSVGVGAPVLLMTWSITPASSCTVSRWRIFTPARSGASNALVAWMDGSTSVKM